MYRRKLVIRAGLVVVSLVIATTATTLFTKTSTTPQTIGKGSAEKLNQAYVSWVETYEAAPRPGPAIGMTWNKGLSSEYSKATGLTEVNLETGEVHVRVSGLDDAMISDVWLVDNLDAKGNTIQLDADDQYVHLGSLVINGSEGVLNTVLDTITLNDMEIDWVVLSRAGETPASGGVLYGSSSLFQKIYHYPQHRISNTDKRYGGLISSASAGGISPFFYPDAALINDGRDIFFNESFQGNGRTCGTCHPADNNFTIDPKFIATLSDDDPLFIAERSSPNPLSENFEKPSLMRKVGLILENTNGFGDLENEYTMRSVPHVLSMRTSLSPPSIPANDGTTYPPNERTGWSGDGSPSGILGSFDLQGTLRDFSVGAVRQHFTKSLSRSAGQDFRFPTEYELDALEAFMLSLGRQEEYDDFTQISLADERADQGRLNYMGEGVPAGGLTCNACHFNGGANTDPNFDFPASVTSAAFELTNRSFAPRSEELLDQPADLVDSANNPFDDGFASGTNLFNVPVVIEAADTGPFFHKNQVDTVEAMIAFYSSQRHLRDGSVLPPIVALNGSQVANVGAFLRVLNADENMRSAIELIDKAEWLRWSDRKFNLALAKTEIIDAIQVLEGGNLHFDDAIPLLVRARSLVKKPWLMHRARNKLVKARKLMIQR